jgi:outer membrane protein
MFVASASWPLWDAGYRLADNARTASAARQAAASFEKTKEDTAVAVHSAWDWRAHSVLAVAAARAEVQAANEALRLAETGLSLGGATLLDVEDARLAAAGAALALAQAQVSEVVAGYTLMSLTGG